MASSRLKCFWLCERSNIHTLYSHKNKNLSAIRFRNDIVWRDDGRLAPSFAHLPIWRGRCAVQCGIAPDCRSIFVFIFSGRGRDHAAIHSFSSMLSCVFTLGHSATPTTRTQVNGSSSGPEWCSNISVPARLSFIELDVHIVSYK